MRRLKLHTKTGFRIRDVFAPVLVRDFRGTLFYSTEWLVPKVKEFNLPAGDYLVMSGAFSPMENPVKYPLYPLPKFERNRNKPYNFKIRFGNNPNKCTIFWDKRTIFFDNSLKEIPLPELDFIKFHEYSHSRFATEVYCDLMAANYMLVKGYNPSQIREAPIKSLSEKQFERKQQFITLTKKPYVR
jgi:hypothetical protein